MGKEYYVYKYIDDKTNDIIYVGLSDRPLHYRIKEHSKEDKFIPYLDNTSVYYAVLANKTEMKVMEKLLIDKYTPILNDMDKHEETMDIEFTEPFFEKYNEQEMKIRTNNKRPSSVRSIKATQQAIQNNAIFLYGVLLPINTLLTKGDYYVDEINRICICVSKETFDFMFENNVLWFGFNCGGGRRFPMEFLEEDPDNDKYYIAFPSDKKKDIFKVITRFMEIIYDMENKFRTMVKNQDDFKSIRTDISIEFPESYEEYGYY